MPCVARVSALLAAALCAAAVGHPAYAQTAAAPANSAQPMAVALQPLTSIPYSPSLDVTSLDRTADPCVDFYKFSCGGWQAHNPIPADQAGWSVYAKLTVENQQFLWGILREDAVASNRTPVQQKVGDYFAACMNVPAIDAQGRQPIEPVLTRVQALRTRGELAAAIASIDHDYPGNYFLSSDVSQDALDPTTEIAEVTAGGLGLPDRDYYLKTDARSVKLREQYVAFVTEMLVLGGDTPEKAAQGAAEVLAIETALARGSLTNVDRRDPHKIYHKMTVAELSRLTPSIDWHAYFATYGAPGISTLNVAEPAFFSTLEHELATQPLDSLRTYLRFHVLAGTARYLSSPFVEANFNFYSKTLRGIPVQPARWKTCTRLVDEQLGEALGQEFVRRTFSAAMKSDTQRMTEQIEAAMAQEIQGLDWMSQPTKTEALRKLHAIRNKIGYPDRWRDYTALTVQRDDFAGDAFRATRFEGARQWGKLGKPVDLNEWGMTPPTVNAYFNPQMNDINFPAGVLQPPLYDTREDAAPNYGNTGATIGHELTHAFDDEGRQFDSTGALRDWWTPADAKGFDQRIQCVRDQYAGYVVVDDIHINSQLTSGEDVADLGGTLLAYIAWKKQTAGETLKPEEGFTPEQRFFVGMAQWACENTRPENERLHAATDPHSPGFARINGVVANMPQFQRAFSCKAGQPMVHVPICKVW